MNGVEKEGEAKLVACTLGKQKILCPFQTIPRRSPWEPAEGMRVSYE